MAACNVVRRVLASVAETPAPATGHAHTTHKSFQRRSHGTAAQDGARNDSAAGAMIWHSVAAMTVVDLLIVGGAIFCLWAYHKVSLARHIRHALDEPARI